MITFTMGYQYGDLNWLSLITNSDVLMTYLMQIWLLNVNDSLIQYIGVLIVLLACSILFVQQAHKNNHQNESNEQRQPREKSPPSDQRTATGDTGDDDTQNLLS